MNTRMVLLAVFAIISAAVTFFLAKTWIDSQRDEMRRRAESMKPNTTESVNVLVAKSNLPSGLILAREHVEWKPWPEKGVSPNYLMEGREKADDVVGNVVRGGIIAGEPITKGRVIAPGDRGFMAAVLRPDMRAVSIRVKPETSVAGFIRPGDHVDLMLLHSAIPPNAESSKPHKLAETVLNDLRVIAVDQHPEDQNGSASLSKTITLEVTKKQAEIVLVASDDRNPFRDPAQPRASGCPAGPARRSARTSDPDLGLGSQPRPAATRQPDKPDAGHPRRQLLQGRYPDRSHPGPRQHDPVRAGCCGDRQCRRQRRRDRREGNYAMNRIVKITTLLFGLMAATAASAQAQHNGQVLSPSSTTIDLSSNQGKLIRLPRPANAVFIADTKIADVSVRSPTLIYVFAKGIGETTLYALDSRDQLVIAQRVVIAPNMDRVKEIFHRLQPDAPVQVASIGDRLLLTGTVDTADAADQLVKVAVSAVGGAATRSSTRSPSPRRTRSISA